MFTFMGSFLFTGLHVTFMVQLGLMTPEEETVEVDKDGSVTASEVKEIGEETRELGLRQRRQVTSSSN